MIEVKQIRYLISVKQFVPTWMIGKSVLPAAVLLQKCFSRAVTQRERTQSPFVSNVRWRDSVLSMLSVREKKKVSGAELLVPKEEV
jgi:hypothetical protein|tara:strand:+ start:99 stop:356 length:258 start_codon:yes stop_codon:yes gene_type:complete